MIDYLINFKKIKNIRDKILYKNISYSLIIKLFGFIINLYLISYLYNYLSIDKYGLWVTIMSFVTWFSFFDVGLSNGLRNISESLSIKNIRKSREYISTSYFLYLSFFNFDFYFILSNHFIDWFLIFKVSNLIDYNSLSLVLNVIIISFLLRFIFQIISFIL